MKVLARQSMLDISIQMCGTIEAAFNLAYANECSISEVLAVSKLSGVDVLRQSVVDFFSINGTNPATELTGAIFTDTSLFAGISVKTFKVLTAEAETPKIRNGQSALDISVERCGTIEAAFNLIALNDFGISEELTAGQVLTLSDVVEKDVVNRFSLDKNGSATAISSTDYNETISQEGIEFWAIENDFIVS